MALVESGASSPLGGMLGSGAMANTEVAAATLESLQPLAAAGLPQTQTAVRNAGVVPCLIQLMSHSSPRVSQPAASLVSILCLVPFFLVLHGSAGMGSPSRAWYTVSVNAGG